MAGHQLRLKIFTLLAAIFLMLVGAEGVLRLFNLGFGNQPLEGHPVLHHDHPKNYSYRVHAPNGEYGGHLVIYDTEGRRVPDNSAAHDPSRPAVIMLGDSFVEARQVDYPHSFVGRLADLFPRVQFLNFGVGSYSPVLSYLQLKATKPEVLEQTAQVIHLIYANDPTNDMSYTENAVFDGTGDIQASPGRGNGLVEFLRRLYVLRLIRRAQLTVEFLMENRDQADSAQMFGSVSGAQIYTKYEDQDLTSLSRGYLFNIKEFLAVRGVPYALSCVPSKLMSNYRIKGTGEFCAQARAWAEDNGVDFVELRQRFYGANSPLFFERDQHFNEAGHQVTSAVFAEYLAAQPVFSAAMDQAE